MQLSVWLSDFGLPSVEAECLQFLAFLKMCPAQVDVKKCCKPWDALTDSYPEFRDGENVLTEFGAFSDYLRKKIPLYALWMDNPNFNTVTSKWYHRNITFPYNFYYTGRRRKSVIHHLRQLYPGYLVTDQDIEYANCLVWAPVWHKGLLGDIYKLCDGGGAFIKPTSLDALVFGYLAPLLKLPLPNDRLQQHMKGCPNLVRFVESIISIYLPLTDEEMKRQKKDMEDWEQRKAEAQTEIRKARQESAKGSSLNYVTFLLKMDPKEEESESSDEFKIRDKILFAVGAAFLSVLAAVHFGIIKVELREVDVNDSRTPELPQDIDVDYLYD